MKPLNHWLLNTSKKVFCFFIVGLNVNNNPIDDVKNLGKKNSVDKKDNTQEIRVVDKIGDGFSLKKKNTESKPEKKKSKSFCSIL